MTMMRRTVPAKGADAVANAVAALAVELAVALEDSCLCRRLRLLRCCCNAPEDGDDEEEEEEEEEGWAGLTARAAPPPPRLLLSLRLLLLRPMEW